MLQAYSQLTYIGLMSIKPTTVSQANHVCVSGHTTSVASDQWGWTDGTAYDYRNWCTFPSPNGDGNCVHIPPRSQPNTWWSGFDGGCAANGDTGVGWNDIPCNLTEAIAEDPSFCTNGVYPTNLAFVCKFQSQLTPTQCSGGCTCDSTFHCVCDQNSGCPNCAQVKTVPTSCDSAVATGGAAGTCVTMNFDANSGNSCQQ